MKVIVIVNAGAGTVAGTDANSLHASLAGAFRQHGIEAQLELIGVGRSAKPPRRRLRRRKNEKSMPWWLAAETALYGLSPASLRERVFRWAFSRSEH
jgi:hypothetical protein